MRPPWELDFSDVKLDFSGFHPLDHGLRECREYPGGRRRHLRLKWDFFWRPALGEALLCRFGRHDPVAWYVHKGGDRKNPRNWKTGLMCSRCSIGLDEG